MLCKFPRGLPPLGENALTQAISDILQWRKLFPRHDISANGGGVLSVRTPPQIEEVANPPPFRRGQAARNTVVCRAKAASASLAPFDTLNQVRYGISHIGAQFGKVVLGGGRLLPAWAKSPSANSRFALKSMVYRGPGVVPTVVAEGGA